ncbi:MAG TPA: ABC transporter transmembrane domain-containing protein, partial [Candidatus Acidoferrum sp.]
MSEATTRKGTPVSNAGQEPPPNKDLRGLMPYLRRYTGSIVIGLFMVFLMGVVTNVLPLATGVMTDTLAGSPAPFEHAGGNVKGPALAAVPRVSTLSRAIPYYAPNSRRTLGIYCLIVVICVAIKGVLSFSGRWILIGVSRDIEYDIRADLLKRLLALEPEFYVRNRTGELMSRSTNDLNSVRMVLGPGIMYSATTIVTMI